MGQKSSPSSTQPICLIGADAGHAYHKRIIEGQALLRHKA